MQRSIHRSKHYSHFLSVCLMALHHIDRTGSQPHFTLEACQSPSVFSQNVPHLATMEKRTMQHKSPARYKSTYIALEVRMRSLQSGAHNDGQTRAHGAVRVLDRVSLGNDDELDVAEVPWRQTTRPRPLSVRRDEVMSSPRAFRSVSQKKNGSGTCYHFTVTGDALCLHVFFCVRRSSNVYFSGTLKCAPYSSKQGKLGTFSMGRCVQLWLEVEGVAEIQLAEH